MADSFATLLDGWRDDPSLAVVADGESTTFAELAGAGRAVAGWLQTQGFRPGDRFGLWMPNRLAWLAMFLGCAQAGLIAVALNTRLRSRDLGDILVRSGCRGLLLSPGFAHGEYATILQDCDPAALQSLRCIIGQVAPGETLPASLVGLPVHDYRAVARYAGAVPVCADAGAGALIVSTSGTTRAPKLALHDQRTLLRHAGAVAADFGIAPDSVQLVVPPLCGVFGFCAMLAALQAGRPIVLLARWDALQAVAAIERHGVTHLSATDEAIRQLLDATERTPVFPAIRFAGYAAFSPALGDIVDVAASRGLVLVGLYGSSELQGLFARQPAEAGADQRRRAGGHPVDPAVRVRVRDARTGRNLPHGVAGELEFHAPGSRMVGYYGDPDATRAAVDADGWFRSGDLGHTTADGGFEFLARMGDLLRLGGFLVSAIEIESAVAEDPAVQACQVVEVLGPGRSGASVMQAVAFVTVVAGAGFDEARLRERAARQLASYKVPVRIFRLDAFPTSEGTNGSKVRKQQLRTWASERLQLP